MMDIEIPLEARRKEKRKQLFRFSIIIVLIVSIISFILYQLQGTISTKDIIIGNVDRGVIEITVNASGKIMPLTEIIITSPINTKILEAYKNPGDFLEIGDPILKLELVSIETDYEQKLDEREVKKSKLLQTRVNLDNNISELIMQHKVKEMQLKQMNSELKNERYLDSIGASTSDKIRQAELNYEVTKLELQQLNQKIKNQKENASAEMKVQELNMSIFEKSLAESHRLLKDARILSPQKATLTFINNQIGSQVLEGEQIAIISDLSQFKVEAEIADTYADRLSSGAKAIIKIGQTQLDGTVVNITPSVKNGIMKFTVFLKDASNTKLRSGLRTDVYVTHGIRDEVMRIPNSSYYIGAGSYELWIVKNDRAEKRTVRLGESSFEYVEVISGLNPDEKVIISDMSQYKNKKSIKIK